MVTPSLVIVGAPNFLSSTTLRPRGPRVTLTVSASVLTPCSSRCRASSEKLRIFAIYGLLHVPTPWTGSRARAVSTVWVGLLLDDREDVAGGEHQVLFAGVLDLGAAVLGVQDGVADLDVDRDSVALVVDPAGADSEDGALLRLLLGGVGDHDARCRRGLSLVRLDHDAVLERLDRNLGRGSHGHTLLGHLMSSPAMELAGLDASCHRAGPSSRVPVRLALNRAPDGRPAGTLVRRVLIGDYAGTSTPSRRVPARHHPGE